MLNLHKLIACSSVLAAFAVGSVAGAQGHPGSPTGIDPFQLTFDEYGNAIVSVFGGQTYTEHGYLAGTGGASGLFLTYDLPETVSTGDVGIAEPPNSDVSDGLRFYDDNTGGHMQYFSDPDLVNPPLADTGLPSNFNDHGFVINETGPEGHNGFLWQPGGNVYLGGSDAPIPEFGTMFGFGGLFAGAGLMMLRRRK